MDPSSERKKREPPDPEADGQPQSKKHALSASSPSILEDVDPKDAPVLLYQNKAMQIRIKEMRIEMQAHEETIKQLTEKQRLNDETLSCAHRTWDQLNDSSLKLLSRLDFNYDGISKGDTPGTTLLHLLLQNPEPLHDITEYDNAMQKRMDATQQVVARLVEAVEKERANNERITALLRDQAPAAIQERLQQLESENKQLTTTINKLQDTQKQTHTTHTHTENQNRSYVKQIEDLQAKLYQLETELTVTRRKVIKQECPLPVSIIAQPRAPTTTTTTTTSTTNGTPSEPVKEEGETSNNNNNKQNGDGGQELADLQALAEGRLEELGKLREEKIGLLRENTRLRDDLAHLSYERIVDSEPYRRLERESRVFRENLERDKTNVARMSAELVQLREARRKDREIFEKEESIKRRVTDSQIKELQETVLKLKLENHEITGHVEKRMASLPSEKYIAELKLLVSMRDSDIKKLKDECERLNIVIKHLNERKGDKVEETLQNKLAEVSDLQEKQRKLERDLEEFARKEKSWISRERDYRSMIDNYQMSSKDRRDLHDLRVAERRLRDEVDDLRREKDDLRRSYDKNQRADVRDMEKKHADEIKTTKSEAEKSLIKLNYEVKELKTELESKTQEYDMMMNEVDSISKAYEDMQAQNKRLLLELSNKEDVTIQVASEGMKMKRQVEQTRIEARDMQERYARAEERCRAQAAVVEELELQLGQAQIKFSRAFDELQGTGIGMEGLRREARDAQAQAIELKQQLQSSDKIASEAKRKVEDLIADLEKEKDKVKRLDEDRSSLKRKLDRAAPRGGGAINYAEEELKGLKQQLTCTVCNDRMKDTVITKCFHVFCHECVATNLQIRKRRCPQCQAAFSQNDVKNLYGFV